MSGGNIYSLTTGENWAFGIFNRGKITKFLEEALKARLISQETASMLWAYQMKDPPQ